MKVLSLLQPWATLVVIGAKKIETRSWNTKYRGELLIHASVGKKDVHRQIMLDFQQQFFHLKLPAYNSLPFGAIIGKVRLDGTGAVEKIKATPEWYISFSPEELAFGDYSPGRYGWLFSDPVQFKTPTPAKGALSLWEFDEGLLLQ